MRVSRSYDTGTNRVSRSPPSSSSEYSLDDYITKWITSQWSSAGCALSLISHGFTYMDWYQGASQQGIYKSHQVLMFDCPRWRCLTLLLCQNARLYNLFWSFSSERSLCWPEQYNLEVYYITSTFDAFLETSPKVLSDQGALWDQYDNIVITVTLTLPDLVETAAGTLASNQWCTHITVTLSIYELQSLKKVCI